MSDYDKRFGMERRRFWDGVGAFMCALHLHKVRNNAFWQQACQRRGCTFIEY